MVKEVDPRKVVIKEINKLIDSAGVDNADMLKNSLKLMGTCPCYEGKGVGGKEKVKRAPTARTTFLGDCMRSAEKGGKGKDMKTCSVEWNNDKEKLTKDFEKKQEV